MTKAYTWSSFAESFINGLLNEHSSIKQHVPQRKVDCYPNLHVIIRWLYDIRLWIGTKCLHSCVYCEDKLGLWLAFMFRQPSV